jgi:myo-inositol-1(or 4)-monophosphatase
MTGATRSGGTFGPRPGMPPSARYRSPPRPEGLGSVTELSPAARAVVARATTQIGGTLDEVRAWLLAASGDVDVEAKTDGTPVTDADREVDDRLATRLSEAFPDHGVLSEERDTVSPDTEWTWVVDPIDGTSNFICRLPYWCISIALAFQGRPVLGIVDAPVLGRRYVASLGGGTFLESRTTSLDGTTHQHRRRRLQVRDAVDWRDGGNRHVPVMLTTATARSARGAGMRLNPRVMGSTALDLAIVAEGVAAASIAVIPKVWDIAAGVLLVTEAGGAVSNLDERSLFPIPPGVEHVDRSAVTAAGPDTAYVREIAEALLPPR